MVDCDFRSVTLQFPASEESRIYALRSAPLARVRLSVGEPAEDQQGRVMTVLEVSEDGGLLTYRVSPSDGSGGEFELPESALNDRLRVNRPEDKLLAGRLDQDIWFTLRYQAWQRLAASARSPVFGLSGPRVSLIGHQLYIAAEVASRLEPRVLLADEVGLGKTIEAGLILHKLILAERVKRVLIIVPPSLQHQWLVEMLRRFNLRFSLFDQERFDASLTDRDDEPGDPGDPEQTAEAPEASSEPDSNPFQSEQRVLCSLDFLCSSPTVARAALAGDWDLMIVDEAHHLSWTETESSLEYDLVAALAAETRGLLLLSATPEQFGRAGHFARLRLLDPDRFHDYQAFLDEEQHYQPVARLAGQLMSGDELDPEQQQLLTDWLGEDPGELPTEQLIDRLVDQHGTGRVMFRNTRSAIQGFPEREVLPALLPRPEGYGDELHPEHTPELDWTSIDPRVPWLIKLLDQLDPAKVLVIASRAATVLALREALQARQGIPAAVFHEGMSILERDRAAAWFAEPDGGAQVLLCSEIGSEGRNFQFAHHLVLFDLPLNPELLEQRIGRLDRIGQSDTIQLHLPTLADGPAETLLRWYHEGLDALQQTSPAAGTVYNELATELQQVLDGEAPVEPLIEKAQQRSIALSADLEAGRDRLLELHSHRPQQAERLVDAIQQSASDSSPLSYMTRYWDAFGIDHEPGPSRSTILQPTNHMRHQHFPGLSDDGATVTFSRGDALAHEDHEFLTWEHPMVRGAMEMLSSDELGAAALTLISNPAIRPGSVLLELIYIAECSAPAALEVGRFLPPSPLRLLVDQQGRDRSIDLAEYLPGDQPLNGECMTRNKKLAHKVIDTLKPKLRPMFSAANQHAERAGQPLIDAAMADMRQSLDAELQRLRQLAQRNPNVRKQEIDALAAQRTELEHYLGSSRVRLDAVRLIVAQ